MVQPIKDNELIHVDFFYKEDMNVPFAISNIPCDQLPDTFEPNTRIELGDKMWLVLKAQPFQKEVFKKTGALKLFLSKPETLKIDPEEILFTLPTVSEETPPVRETEPSEEMVLFKEDDWRQFEFISIDHFYLIEEELSLISQIYENDCDASGFKNIHVRKKITDPIIRAKLTCGMLKDYFQEEKTYLSIGIKTETSELVDGFCLQTASGWNLWGKLNEDEMITVLNVSRTKKSDIGEFKKEVSPFLEKKGLYLVDWPHRFWCGQGKSDFLAYGTWRDKVNEVEKNSPLNDRFL